MRVSFRLIGYEIVPGSNGQQVIRITVDPKGNNLSLSRLRPKTDAEGLDIHTLSFIDSGQGTLFSVRAMDPLAPAREILSAPPVRSQEPDVKKELTVTDQDGTLAEEIIAHLTKGANRPARFREIAETRFQAQDVPRLIDAAIENNNNTAGQLGLNQQVRDFVLTEIQGKDERRLKAWITQNKSDGKLASGLLQEERIRRIVLG